MLRKSVQRLLNTYISTGYPALDQALGGGYRKNSKIFINVRHLDNILCLHIPKGCYLSFDRDADQLDWLQARFKTNNRLVVMTGVRFQYNIFDLRLANFPNFKKWRDFAKQHDVIMEFGHSHLSITKNYPPRQRVYLDWNYKDTKLEIT